MKALVTGATGFVGAAIAKTLLASGWQVRVLARAGSDRGNLRQLAAQVVEGDLNDLRSLERALDGFGGKPQALIARQSFPGARMQNQILRAQIESAFHLAAKGENGAGAHLIGLAAHVDKVAGMDHQR